MQTRREIGVEECLLKWRINDGQTGEEASFRFSVTLRIEPLSTEMEGTVAICERTLGFYEIDATYCG